MYKKGTKLKSKSTKLVITIQGHIGEIYFYTYGQGSSCYDTEIELKKSGYKPIK